METLENTYKSYLNRGVNPERLEAIKKYAGKSILDVGCGSGAYVLELANSYDIRGSDYQKFPTWDTMPNLFFISDAHQLNLEDESVDTILSFETLEHLDNPLDGLKEYYRVCKKNIILTVPNCQLSQGMKDSQLIYYHWIDATHINFFNRESIQELVKKSGFQVVDFHYINQISLFPLIKESFGLNYLPDKILRKVFQTLQKKEYYLTCMIIAEK